MYARLVEKNVRGVLESQILKYLCTISKYMLRVSRSILLNGRAWQLFHSEIFVVVALQMALQEMHRQQHSLV